VLKLISGTSRGIRLVNASIGIPVITNTKTNLPILHSQNINRYINIDPQTFNPTAEYVVQISDNSLSKIGILPNDLLLIHATHEIYCGQLVVAKVNDIPYIRRFYSKGDLIYLNTESEEFESKKCDINKDKISIEGIVVGSLREQITKLVQGPPNKSYEY
jgi:repressor LexA